MSRVNDPRYDDRMKHRLWPDRFTALIFDNEVTVGEFVTHPALPWIRLVQDVGVFQVAEGYPKVLTATQARFEMKNWDTVSLPAICSMLKELDNWVDYVVFGNNAGQGLPLAECLQPDWIADRAAIIYAKALPEIGAYQRLGYRNFFRRSEAAARLLGLAKDAGKPLALCFINTIQHNPSNYHEP